MSAIYAFYFFHIGSTRAAFPVAVWVFVAGTDVYAALLYSYYVRVYWLTLWISVYCWLAMLFRWSCR
jgi:hypothetical protein